MRADNTAALRTAESRHRDELTQRAVDAIARLTAAGSPVTFAAVARSSGVSRSFLYRTPGIAQAIEERRGVATVVPAAERMTERSRVARLEGLRADNVALRAEVAELRQQNAVLLGELRHIPG